MVEGGFVALLRSRMLPFTNWVSFRLFDAAGREVESFDLGGGEALTIWSLCNEMMIAKNRGRETTFVSLMAQTFDPALGQGSAAHLYTRAIDNFARIDSHPSKPRFVGLGRVLAAAASESASAAAAAPPTAAGVAAAPPTAAGVGAAAAAVPSGSPDDEISFVIDEKLWIQPSNPGVWENYLRKRYRAELVSEGMKLSYEFFKQTLVPSEYGAVRDTCDILLGLLHNIWASPEHYFLCAISCVGEQIKKNTATLDLVASLLYCANFDVPVRRLLDLAAPSTCGLEDFVNPMRLGPMRVLSAPGTSRSKWKYPRFTRLVTCASANRTLFFPNGSTKQKRATVAFLLDELCLDEYTNDWITGGSLVHFKGGDERSREEKGDDEKAPKEPAASKAITPAAPSAAPRNTATHVREMIVSAASGAGNRMMLLSERNKGSLGSFHLNMSVLGGYLPQSGHGTSFLGNASFDTVAIERGCSGPVQLKTAHLVYAFLKRAFDAMLSTRRLFLAQAHKRERVEPRVFLTLLAAELRAYINQSLRDLALWPP